MLSAISAFFSAHRLLLTIGLSAVLVAVAYFRGKAVGIERERPKLERLQEERDRAAKTLAEQSRRINELSAMTARAEAETARVRREAERARAELAPLRRRLQENRGVANCPVSEVNREAWEKLQ